MRTTFTLRLTLRYYLLRWIFCTFIYLLPSVSAQCRVWLFFVVSWFHYYHECYLYIFWVILRSFQFPLNLPDRILSVRSKCAVILLHSLCIFNFFGFLLLLLLLLLLSEFLTSQLWLGYIHLSWDAVINRIRLGGLICSLRSFIQLNMCLELQIFAAVYMYWGAS